MRASMTILLGGSPPCNGCLVGFAEDHAEALARLAESPKQPVADAATVLIRDVRLLGKWGVSGTHRRLGLLAGETDDRRFALALRTAMQPARLGKLLYLHEQCPRHRW